MKRGLTKKSIQVCKWSIIFGGLIFALAGLLYLSTQSSQNTSLIPSSHAAFQDNELFFVENQGQSPADVRFMAKRTSQTILFTGEGLRFDLEKSSGLGVQRTQVALNFLSTEPGFKIRGVHELATKIHFLRGPSSKWRTNVPTFQEVIYQELYSGIDLLVRGEGIDLKYEFLVRPGADPHKIRLAYQGIEGLSVAHDGGLTIGTSLGTLRDKRPYIYQDIEGRRVEVVGRYIVEGHSYGFALGNYDPSRPLIIDPTIQFATYFGSNNYQTVAHDIAIDSSRNIYVTGEVSSAGLATSGAYDESTNGGTDIFIAKFPPTGAGPTYFTYLGGSLSDAGYDIVVDSSGNAYITGESASSDFPTTVNAYDQTNNGSSDIIVSKLSTDGATLSYSSYLGGSSGDGGRGVKMDGTGRYAYLLGYSSSSNFPTSVGAYDTTCNSCTSKNDLVVIKLDLNDGALGLDYSTYVGGNDIESYGAGNDIGLGGSGIAVDSSGDIFIHATTRSNNFPSTAGVFDTTHNGGRAGINADAVLFKISPDGAGAADLVFSTFFGGADDEVASDVAVDAAGNIYISGETNSDHTVNENFPSAQTPGLNGFDTTYNCELDDGTNVDNWCPNIYVAKLNSTATAITYSTYIGDTSAPTTNAFANLRADMTVDNSGKVYLCGEASASYPVTGDAYETTYGSGGYGWHITVLAANGNSLSYATYIDGKSVASSCQGLAVTADGNYIYAAGRVGNGHSTLNAYMTDAGGANSSAPMLFGFGPNSQPTPAAGADNIVVDEASVSLSGTCNDGDAGDTLAGTWTVASGSCASLVSTAQGAASDRPRTITATCTAPNVSVNTNVVFRLTCTSGSDSVPDDRTVTINAAPVATLASVSATEDTAIAIALSALDPNDEALTYTIMSNPTYGTLSGTAPNVTYTPNANYDGTDSFTFRVSDAYQDSTIVTVSINVGGSNDPPVCVERTSLMSQSFSSRANYYPLSAWTCTDPEGDAVTTSWVQIEGGGTNETTLLFTNSGEIDSGDSGYRRGTYRLQMVAADSRGATSTSGVVTVTLPNNPPTSPALSNIDFGTENLGIDGEEGVQYYAFSRSINLNDVTFDDLDGDNLSYEWSVDRAVSNGAVGTYGITSSGSGFLSFWVKQAGTYTLTVTAADGQGGEASKTIRVFFPLPDSGVPLEIREDGYSGRFQSPVIPSLVRVNGVAASKIEAVEDGSGLVSASTSQALYVKDTDTNVTADTYAFTVSSLGSLQASNLTVEIYTDVDGENVLLTSASFNEGDPRVITGYAIGGGGCSLFPLVYEDRGQESAGGLVVFGILLLVACFLFRARFLPVKSR